ncbi:DUF1275 family protein [Streptomyces ossamyceticus]|nr:DUF1275 family protein [Streptomyces ossamyceticus]
MLLATVTGVVDAAGFLALDGVFYADKSGIVVMPAVGGVGVREVPVTAVAWALSGFLLGVALTARFLSEGAAAASRSRGRSAVVLTLLSALAAASCPRMNVGAPAHRVQGHRRHGVAGADDGGQTVVVALAAGAVLGALLLRAGGVRDDGAGHRAVGGRHRPRVPAAGRCSAEVGHPESVEAGL